MVEGLTNERKDRGERADKCGQGFVSGMQWRMQTCMALSFYQLLVHFGCSLV